MAGHRGPGRRSSQAGSNAQRPKRMAEKKVPQARRFLLTPGSPVVIFPSMTDNINPTDANIRMARLVRKDLLPHGKQRRIARKLGLEDITVSLVMNDKADGKVTTRDIARIQREIARRIKLPIGDAFPVLTIKHRGEK